MASREWNSLAPRVQALLSRCQNDLPVRLSALARQLGVTVKSATLPPGISGELRPSGAGFVIRVNRHDPRRRQRFTVAHELAHYLLHRGEIGEGIEDDVLYRSALSDAREAEANRLAADIIMPRERIQRERGRFQVLNDEAVSELADLFGVSEAAMKIRLGL